MNIRPFISNGNLLSGKCRTLSEPDLELCKPILSRGGRTLRAFCPFHGSDHQRSLSVNLETGAFKCFACNEWGYMRESQRRWRANRGVQVSPRVIMKNTRPPRQDLGEILRIYQAALPGSRGQEYLRLRGISLEFAKHYRLGFAATGKWLHPARDWNGGRLVVPHTDPDGNLLNLYGRAIELEESVPKEMRHDHLPGGKGYFNATALQGLSKVYVTEGPFDALSLIAAGLESVIAVFGVGGWRWDWLRLVRTIVFALDADAPGQNNWREVALQARLKGKKVALLPPEAYGGSKDPNEAWMAGTLNLDA
jgi:DNA primase